MTIHVNLKDVLRKETIFLYECGQINSINEKP